MVRRVFIVPDRAVALARVPLLPANEPGAGPDPLLAEGIFLASRQTDAETARERDADRARVAATVRAYEIRARRRPTPHGAFAGVAPAVFEGRTLDLRLDGRHRARSNPSPAWLSVICARALGLPEVLPRLRLSANNLVVRRGQRLEHEQQAVPGDAGPRRVSIRATDATLLILRACRAGATYTEVVTEVACTWPSVPESVVRATVLELARQGFLLTDLLPDDITEDPLGHLLDKLSDICELREPLTRLRDHLSAADQQCPGTPERLAVLTAASSLADDLAEHPRSIVVDVAADAQVRLPATLAQEVAEAASVLWRTGAGQDPLAEYHRRFLERYGPQRLVPLLEVADEVLGLGQIDPDLDAYSGQEDAQRSTVLAAMLEKATAHGRTEVVLDAERVAALDNKRSKLPPPPTAEIYARVVAATPEDLAAGRLRLAVCTAGGTQQAGSTFGRFASLLPDIRPGIPAPASLAPSAAMVAELVVCPRSPDVAGVTPPTGHTQYRIPVGVAGEEGDLDLGDLLLVSDRDCLLLWSAKHDRQVVPVLYSRLGMRFLPPVARVLQLLGLHACRPWHNWSWGQLGNRPFQPRVRYGRTILAPARWRLPATLIEAASDRTAWEQALQTWRATTKPAPPEVVVTEDSDRQLPLDLGRKDDRELFRRYVRRGLVAVTEQPGGPDAVQAVLPGLAGSHLLELVIPLARRAAETAVVRPSAATVRPAGQGLHLPGGRWLSLSIPAPAAHHDDILTALAPVVADLEGQVDRWFWLRYANTAHGPHLRIRFHGEPAVLGGQVLPAISAWCQRLIGQRLARGFSVEPYDQEIERYGGPDAITAAEDVFSADSALVLTALSSIPDPDQRLLLAALSAAEIARTVSDSDPAALHGRHVDPAGRKRVTALRPLLRRAGHLDGTSSTIVPFAHQAWTKRHTALIAYRDTVKLDQRPACASALIHMHANRLLGDLDNERIARALATDLLHREPA